MGKDEAGGGWDGCCHGVCRFANMGAEELDDGIPQAFISSCVRPQRELVLGCVAADGGKVGVMGV